ncbi:MAG: hypothetical protein JXN61_11375 [Sedimentisphaerales bacterium]|nr:hypothetical protein [Sedimentisphaerales bacterium]
MGLISNGVSIVRALELPGGIWSDGGYVGVPRTVLVTWRSSFAEKFYQVYVNGRYARSTCDSEQRQMVAAIPTSLDTAVRIEVFGVEGDEADTDFSSQITPFQANSGRVRLTLLRSQNLPIDATAEVYFDRGTGEIDYIEPLSERPIRIWPSLQDKAGFGMSRFAGADFGYDSAAAVGFGKGCFGNGQFGLDADGIEWVSPPLSAGVYRFAVRVCDSAGKQSLSSESGEVVVIPSARPAEHMSVFSFDKDTNQLVLSVS